jgi:hypothetical protein
MVEIKDDLQLKLNKHYYPLIELGAKMGKQLPDVNVILVSHMLSFDTTDQLRENIIYHETYQRRDRR